MIKKDYFIPRMFYKLLIPSIFSSLGFALADMADALVLGQKVGATGLAAISLCLPLFMLINLFMDGFGIGGSVHFSQKLGEGNTKKALACFNRTWMCTLAVGLLIALVVNVFPKQFLSLLGTAPKDGELYIACKNYMRIIALGAPFLMLNIVFSNFLRNDNNAGLATVGFLVGNAVDIALNIVLVVLFDMGTVGAALSTVIGSALAIALYMPGIIGKKAGILKIQLVKPDIKETLYCFRTGFSTSIQHLFRLIFLLVANRMLMNISGEGGVAVFDVVYNVSFFIVYLYNGTAEASQPLISTFSGENNEADCRCVLKLSKIYGIGLGAIAALLIFAFAENVSSLFGITAKLMPLSVLAVRTYCVGFAFTGLNILYQNYYQSKENTKIAFFIALMRGLVILVPSVIIFAHIGIHAIWLMFPVTELVTLAVFYIYRKYSQSNETEFAPERILRVMIENESDDIGDLIDKSMDFCEKWNASEQQKYSVTLVMEELCMSIIRNAMKNASDGKIRITLLAMEDGDFVLHVLDNAAGFNPFSLKSKKLDAGNEFDIDEISMMMIKKKTKQYMYRRSNGFNSLMVRI
ncbi:MAG: MATE family efflux transporter [Clostridiales bacterium]|nr:MATE family efflux transporter [Clostridiales bacterium]